MWPFTHHVRIPGGPLFPAWEETTLCPWSWLQGLGGFIQQPVFVQRREQRATLSRSWPLLLGLHWPPWTGSLGLRPPPLTPVAKVRPSPDLQSSAHTPRGLQPHDASGEGQRQPAAGGREALPGPQILLGRRRHRRPRTPAGTAAGGRGPEAAQRGWCSCPSPVPGTSSANAAN